MHNLRIGVDCCATCLSEDMNACGHNPCVQIEAPAMSYNQKLVVLNAMKAFIAQLESELAAQRAAEDARLQAGMDEISSMFVAGLPTKVLQADLQKANVSEGMKQHIRAELRKRAGPRYL